MGFNEFQSNILAGRLNLSVNDFFTKHQASIPSATEFNHGQEAIDAIAETVRSGGKIWLVSDYDADGVGGMASSIYLLHYVMGVPMENIIPQVSRRSDGYGLTIPTVEKKLKYFEASKETPDLLITMDIGSANGESTDLLKERLPNLKVVVTDHHHVPEKGFPENITAFINPNKPGCDYPDKTICGASVVFFVLDAVRIKLQNEGWVMNADPSLAYSYLACSTIADVVSMRSPLNRLIVSYGLHLQNQGVFPAWRQLKKTLDAKEPITEMTMGFSLGPMVNATTRLQKKENSPLMFFTSATESRAGASLEILQKINDERKSIQKDLYRSAFNEAEKQADAPVAVIKLDDNLPGVAGGVAGMLVTDFNKPVILIMPTSNKDVLSGSSRAPEGYDLVSAFNNIKEGVLLKAGGHKGAAGLSLLDENFNEFFEEINKQMAEQAKEAAKEDPVAYFDMEITDGVDLNSAMSNVESLAPYGQEFEAPVFLIKGEVTGIQNISKKTDAHKKISVSTPAGTVTMSYFNAPSSLTEASNTFLVVLNRNYFNGSVSIQMHVNKALTT